MRLRVVAIGIANGRKDELAFPRIGQRDGREFESLLPFPLALIAGHLLPDQFRGSFIPVDPADQEDTGESRRRRCGQFRLDHLLIGGQPDGSPVRRARYTSHGKKTM